MRKARRYYELPYFIKSWRNILSARAGFFTLILLALFPLFCAEASDSLVLRDGKETYSLGPYLEILEDKQGKWRIDDVTTPEISKKFLRDGRETPHLGMTDSVFWIRFTIEDRTSGREQWLLELDFPHMDYIDLYLPRSDGAFEIKQAGDMRPMRVREIAHRNPVFLLPVSSPKATFYLRADAKGVTMFPLYIRTYRAFLETDYRRQWLLGLFFGFLSVMAGYNLFLFFLMKDRNYLYYFAFVATYGLYELAANGFTLGVLFPENPKIYDHFLWVLVVMPVLATNLFSWSFLHTSFYAPSMDRLLKGLFVAGILLIPAMFVTPSVAYKKIVGLNTLVVVAVSFLSSIPCYLKGYRPARFFSSPDSFMGRVRLPSHYPTLALSLSGSSPATA